MDRLVEAIASGAQTFLQVKDKMESTESERLALTEELEAIESGKTIVLHPKIASDYRREIANLDRLLNDDLRETREEVMPRIRALAGSVILTPAKVGRGVDIQITGKLARMIELATGRPLDDLGMITLERVKGIEPSS